MQQYLPAEMPKAQFEKLTYGLTLFQAVLGFRAKFQIFFLIFPANMHWIRYMAQSNIPLAACTVSAALTKTHSAVTAATDLKTI